MQADAIIDNGDRYLIHDDVVVENTCVEKTKDPNCHRPPGRGN